MFVSMKSNEIQPLTSEHTPITQCCISWKCEVHKLPQYQNGGGAAEGGVVGGRWSDDIFDAHHFAPVDNELIILFSSNTEKCVTCSRVLLGQVCCNCCY